MKKLIRQLAAAMSKTNKAAHDRRIARQVEEEISLFNILRVSGTDYITYRGLIVSREKDDDLLDRLAELRSQAAEQVRAMMEGGV